MKKIYMIAAFCSFMFAAGLSAQNAPVVPYDAKAVNSKLATLEAPAQLKDAAKIKSQIATFRKDEKFGTAAVYTFDLIEAGLAANGDAKKIKLPKAPDALNDNEKAEAFFNASKVFMNMRNYPIAQFFGAVELKKPPVYVCDVVDQAPIGVYGWVNSPIVKDEKKRAVEFEKYNEKAAALLINDVNTVRDSATLKSDSKCPISFFMQADKRGISVFVESKDDKVDEVLAGLEYGGMYEMYLQPGHGEFYHQWMLYVNPEKCDFVNWMSPHKNFRPLKDYLKYEVAPIKDGIGIYFFIPWTALYDKLPDSKSEWSFGVIPWVRAGGFTWGSGQVHELNRFGKVKFNGIEKLMPEIKKQLVLAAWGKFKRESGDIKTFWNDEQRGDRAFEKDVLIPFVEKLENYGKSVNSSMDSATVEKLFNEAVPAWNEFKYRVEELRRDYLEKQFITK